jgi:hypothetical protein
MSVSLGFPAYRRHVIRRNAKVFRKLNSMESAFLYIVMNSETVLEDFNWSGDEQEEESIFWMLLHITDVVLKFFSSTKLSLLFIERNDVSFHYESFRLYTYKQKKKSPPSSFLNPDWSLPTSRLIWTNNTPHPTASLFRTRPLQHPPPPSLQLASFVKSLFEQFWGRRKKNVKKAEKERGRGRN